MQNDFFTPSRKRTETDGSPFSNPSLNTRMITVTPPPCHTQDGSSCMVERERSVSPFSNFLDPEAAKFRAVPICIKSTIVSQKNNNYFDIIEDLEQCVFTVTFQNQMYKTSPKKSNKQGDTIIFNIDFERKRELVMQHYKTIYHRNIDVENSIDCFKKDMLAKRKIQYDPSELQYKGDNYLAKCTIMPFLTKFVFLIEPSFRQQHSILVQKRSPTRPKSVNIQRRSLHNFFDAQSCNSNANKSTITTNQKAHLEVSGTFDEKTPLSRRENQNDTAPNYILGYSIEASPEKPLNVSQKHNFLQPEAPIVRGKKEEKNPRITFKASENLFYRQYTAVREPSFVKLDVSHYNESHRQFTDTKLLEGEETPAEMKAGSVGFEMWESDISARLRPKNSSYLSDMIVVNTNTQGQPLRTASPFRAAYLTRTIAGADGGDERARMNPPPSHIMNQTLQNYSVKSHRPNIQKGRPMSSVRHRNNESEFSSPNKSHKEYQFRVTNSNKFKVRSHTPENIFGRHYYAT